MKLNSLVANSARSRSVQLAILGSITFATLVACSEESGPPAAPPLGTSGTFSTSGTTSTAGTSSTAGTAAGGTATGGTFGTAGTDAGGTGGAFVSGGSAGTDAGGTASGGTAGTGGDATAGTGGTFEQPKAYCETQTAVTLPAVLETGNPSWGWSEGGPGAQISDPMDLAVDACMTRVNGAVGSCSKWRYSPAATPTPVWVIWMPLANGTHTCLPEDVTAIAFCARGVKGGEKVSFGGAGVLETEATLTNEWALQTIPVTASSANSFSVGVEKAFVWKIVPPETGTAEITEFFLDKLQFVKDTPTADYCAAAAAP